MSSIYCTCLLLCILYFDDRNNLTNSQLQYEEWYVFCICTIVIIYLLYFAWENQRQKQYCICHTMSSVLYKNTAQWLTNTVHLHWLVCSKQVHVHGFLLLVTWIYKAFCILQWMATVYSYAINDRYYVAMCLSVVIIMCCSMYLTYPILHTLTFLGYVSWGMNCYLLPLFAYTHPFQVHCYFNC